MKQLAQPRTLGWAALAAVPTLLACLPRFLRDTRYVDLLWLMLPLFYWCAFMLWGFVFGWHTHYSGRPVFLTRFRPGVWLAAAGYAIGTAALMHFFIDPALRQLSPREYPPDIATWAGLTLATLAFMPLFLCFAPFAFFLRLTQNMRVAPALTVMAGLVVVYFQLKQQPVSPPLAVTVALVIAREVGVFVTVWLYLEGGAVLVWCTGLLVQARLLIDIIGKG